MRQAFSRRPSPALVISLIALFVAIGGTAAASTTLLVSGDSLIKKNSLSGNRLKNHTVTGTQVNLNKLGKVPLAKNADTAANANHASTADTATNANHASTADTATNAGHATNADTAGTVATLASGKSESGMFGAGGGSSTTFYIGEGITYSQPLATPILNSHIVDVPGASATHCPAVGQAEAGYLCLYERITNGVGAGYGYSEGFTSPSVGVVLYWPITGADPYSGGEYTVTAP